MKLMKENEQKYLDLLEEAESKFNKRLFGPAKDCLLQAERIKENDKITEKIKQCTLQLKKQKSSQKILKDARKFLKKKDTKKALEYFKKAQKIFYCSNVEAELNNLIEKKDYENNFALAQENENKKEFKEAISKYLKILKNNNLPKVKERLAISLAKNNEFREALQHFQFTEKSSNEVRYYYGISLAGITEFSKAIKILKPLSDKLVIKELIIDFEKRFEEKKQNLIIEYQQNLRNNDFLEAEINRQDIRQFDKNNSLLKETENFLFSNIVAEYFKRGDIKKALEYTNDVDKQLDIFALNRMFCLKFAQLQSTETLDDDSLKLLFETISYGLTYFYSPNFKKLLKTNLPEKFSSFEVNEIREFFFKEIESYIVKHKISFPKKASYIDAFWKTEVEAIRKIEMLSKRKKEVKNLIVAPYLSLKIGTSKEIISILQNTYKRRDENFYYIISLYSNVADAYRYYVANEIDKGEKILLELSDNSDYANKFINSLFKYSIIFKQIKSLDSRFKKHFPELNSLFKINKKYYNDIVQYLLSYEAEDIESKQFSEILEYFITQYSEKKLALIYSDSIIRYIKYFIENNEMTYTQAKRIIEKSLKIDPKNKELIELHQELRKIFEFNKAKQMIGKNNKPNKVTQFAISAEFLSTKVLVLTDLFQVIATIHNEMESLDSQENMIRAQQIKRKFIHYLFELGTNIPELESNNFDLEHYLEMLENHKISIENIVDILDSIVEDEE